MPTYRNTSSKPYWERGIEVKQFSTKETEKILTESSTLRRVSDAPYYNPYVSNTTLTFSGAQTKTINITNIDKSEKAIIWNILGCNINVYVNSVSNTPAIGLVPVGQSVEIFLKKSTDAIVCVSDGIGSCQVLITKAKL